MYKCSLHVLHLMIMSLTINLLKNLRLFVNIFITSVVLIFMCTYVYGSETNKMGKQNRLSKEKSPYLLQHADNPVDWYPWGQEAFDKAKKEDKPILLSIGYSTCHWCHVMEHESFEDEQVAKLMNETFISIKVDREERPDIDNVYMSVCHMLSQGSCGWPLNIIMTPDKKPFFAATYIPKYNRFGRAGMMDLVPRVADMWKTKREDLLKSADKITFALKQNSGTKSINSSQNYDKSMLDLTFAQLEQRFDTIHGGYGRAPKFPSPHNNLFLLRYWKRTGNKKALQMVEKTLTEMRMGGIYDHVGFGFHRYSTDAEWLVPHFEKMLYDQAMIAMAYTETYLATKNEFYKETAEEIFEYVLRDMTSEVGGFYSAEDADSEGEEGKFYVWQKEELIKIVGKGQAELFSDIYEVKERGNFSDEASGKIAGDNILHLKKSLGQHANDNQKSEEELLKIVEEARQKLFKIREKRVHPYKDDKILVDWNGLMIAALAKAAKAFDNKKYSDHAEKAAEFIISQMKNEDGSLLHRYRQGESGIEANIDDYAFMIWGLTELYEATFNVKYLKNATELNSYALSKFWDEQAWGFYFTPEGGEELLVRPKEIYDGAIPSANSVFLLNLLRLSKLTADSDLEDKAFKLSQAFFSNVSKHPSGFTQFMAGLDFALGPSYEVVLVGEPGKDDITNMIYSIRKEYFPSKVVLFKNITDESKQLEQIAPYSKGHIQLKGKATAYVCKNYVCNLPTNDTKKMISLLKSES